MWKSTSGPSPRSAMGHRAIAYAAYQANEFKVFAFGSDTIHPPSLVRRASIWVFENRISSAYLAFGNSFCLSITQFMDHASHKRTSANESKTCMAKEEAISCQAAKIFSCQLLISATSKKKQIPASLTVVKRKKEDYTWGLWYTWLLALVSVKRGLHLATLCHTYLTESARVAAVMRLSPQSATWAQQRPAWRGSLPGWRWRHSGPVPASCRGGLCYPTCPMLCNAGREYTCKWRLHWRWAE